MVVTAGRGTPLPPYASASMTYAVETSTPALIRPGFAGPPYPQGKAIGKPCMAYVENYRS